MHGLRKRLIGPCEKNQDLRVGVEKILPRKTPHRAVLIYRMHDRPAERKENNAVPLQIQLVKLANADSVDQFELGENNLDLNFDQLTASPIRDSELKRRLAAIRSDNRIAAVNNSCRRAGESAEDYACRQRNADDVDQRLYSNESVGSESNRDDVPVSDGRESVDAEEERPIERLISKTSDRGLQCARPTEQERKREQCVDRDVRYRDKAEKLQPRYGEQPVVKAQCGKWIEPFANYIERSITIQ